MRAVVGDDALWKPLPGFFTPGTPLYSENGGEILKGPRRLDAAKRLLADSGYSGQPVTCVVAQDLQITKAQGEVTADLLRKLGVNVDFAAVDWGTNAARRAQKSPPGQGGCKRRKSPPDRGLHAPCATDGKYSGRATLIAAGAIQRTGALSARQRDAF